MIAALLVLAAIVLLVGPLLGAAGPEWMVVWVAGIAAAVLVARRRRIKRACSP